MYHSYIYLRRKRVEDKNSSSNRMHVTLWTSVFLHAHQCDNDIKWNDLIIFCNLYLGIEYRNSYNLGKEKKSLKRLLSKMCHSFYYKMFSHREWECKDTFLL